MRQALNPARPSANSLRNRLSKIVSAPRHVQQRADSWGKMVTRGVPPTMLVNEPLVGPKPAAMRVMVGMHLKAHARARFNTR